MFKYGKACISFIFQPSRKISPIFTSNPNIPAQQDLQQVSMAMPYVEQFKFDEVLNRYNVRNGTFQHFIPYVLNILF